MDGVKPLPYRLPEVMKAIKREGAIVVVEGEKDADSLARVGIEATSCHGGARRARKRWPAALTPHFRGGHVILCGDSDRAGRDHVAEVGAALVGTARSIRHLDITKVWPECPEKGDISDWIETGGATYETILAAIEEAPVWEAPKRTAVAEEKTDLEQMNERFAVVRVGGKTRVMEFQESPALGTVATVEVRGRRFPLLLAKRIGNALEVKCPHCSERKGQPVHHEHGPFPGHFRAGCDDPQSPFRRTGYILGREPARTREELTRRIRRVLVQHIRGRGEPHLQMTLGEIHQQGARRSAG